MTVRELIAIAADVYEVTDIDLLFRAVNNVIRDINGVFRGLHKTRRIFSEDSFLPGYRYKGDRLTGTVQIAGLPPNMAGTGTQFATELTVGDKITVNGQIYTVTAITNATIATVTPATQEQPALSIAYRIDSENTLILSGTEKTILKVIVDDLICQEVKDFDKLSETTYSYIRQGYNELHFADLPDDPTIEIEALFAIPFVADKTDEIDFPMAWEAIFTNGILYYISKIPRYRDTDASSIYSQHYY